MSRTARPFTTTRRKENRVEGNGNNRYYKPVNQFTRTTIGKPEKRLTDAATSMGLDYSGLSHEVTINFLQHIIKRHTQGNLAIGERDYKKIPGIVKSPDMAIIGAIRGKKIFNAYAKRIDGETYLYFDEVMDSTHNKALRGNTFYKIKKELDMDNFVRIVTMNRKSDVSGAKKIIAAGGHPGGEA